MIRRLLPLLCCFTALSLHAAPATFAEAKRLAWPLFAQQSTEFYCGCKYSGNDGPGMRDLSPGETYSFDLQFVGVIEDVCNQVSLLPTHTWSATCSASGIESFLELFQFPPPQPSPLVGEGRGGG